MGPIIDFFSSVFHSLVSWLVATVGALGYPGVVGLMFLESSLFPFPSEVVIPPAGYLARTGEMNIVLVIVFGILGSVLGALFNYWLAARWGRKIFERFVKPATLDKAEAFFAKHGHISTFTARLLPVIRQYVSLPAGLARMKLSTFVIFTAIGSGIWVTLLAALGYMLGGVVDEGIYKTITWSLIGLCALLVAIYLIAQKVRKKR